MIRVVVFDLGQVLASPAGLYREPAGLLDVDPAAYAARYWTDRRAYDTGGPATDYWHGILAGLGLAVTPGLVDRLDALDAALWVDVRPSALAVVEEVRARGVRTALLSNAPLSLGEAVRGAAWVDRFDAVFISADLRLAKPDPRIFGLVTGQLGVAPDEVAFIDDREPNVVAATGFGWQAHLWVDDTDTSAWLRRHLR